MIAIAGGILLAIFLLFLYGFIVHWIENDL